MSMAQCVAYQKERIIITVNKKRIVLIVAWFILVLCVVMILIGCSTSKLNLEPLPPEKLQDLLYKENVNFAYKSVTKKDYEAKDEC